MGHRTFSKSFKENAVKLSYERSSLKELAKELGIAPNLLSKWRREESEYGSASFLGRGVEILTDEQRRIKELEKSLKNKELELGKSNEARAERVAKLAMPCKEILGVARY